MLGQYATDDILVDIDTEGKRDLLGDAPAAEARVPSFHLDDHGDQLRRRPFGSWLTTPFGCEQQAVLPFHERPMEAQDRGGLQYDGSAGQPGRAHEGGAKPRYDSIHRPKVRRSLAAPIEDQ